MSAQQDRIERSLKRLGFQLGKGGRRAFKTTAISGLAAPNATGGRNSGLASAALTLFHA
jgi:hypothetical protein